MEEEYIRNYGIISRKLNSKEKKELDRVKLNNLLKPPKKEKGLQAPKFLPKPKDIDHQADLLFLPQDEDGSKYCLVVVDVGTRLVDAEPLKNKSQSTINNAIKKIYDRGILSKPKRITTDAGTEFNGLQKALGIGVRRALPQRHRQVAIVEAMNKKIGRAVFIAQYARELVRDTIDTNWVKDLPHIIKLLNKKQIEKNKKTKPDPRRTIDSPPTYIPKNILEVGQKVHRILDGPRSLQGQKLSGNFRHTDIRFNPKPDVIESIVLTPGQPLMYRLKGINNTLYTEGQLRPA